MSIHLEKEINQLRKDLLSLGSIVENSINMAIEALVNEDKELANKVIEQDFTIDELEVEIEESCLKVLALHQPVAIDLRIVTSVLKINSDLERIGDLAVNVAERALEIPCSKFPDLLQDIKIMGYSAKIMVKHALDSFVSLNTELAHLVWKTDDEVDEKMYRMFKIVKEQIKNDLDNTDFYISFLSIARYFERIADSATNIAEDVIYIKEGKIFRHQMHKIK